MEEPGRLYSPWGRKESDMTERLHSHKGKDWPQGTARYPQEQEILSLKVPYVFLFLWIPSCPLRPVFSLVTMQSLSHV